jgi:hypothetical protein
MLEVLPYELKRWEIHSRLDEPSRMVLRNVLLGCPYKPLSVADQAIVISHGLKFTKHFFRLKLLNEHILCDLIIEHGDLKMLEWARAMNCPWSDLSLSILYLYGNMDMYNWAVKSGCPFMACDSATWAKLMFKTNAEKFKAKYLNKDQITRLADQLTTDTEYQKLSMDIAVREHFPDGVFIRRLMNIVEFKLLWNIVCSDGVLFDKIRDEWYEALTLYRQLL